MATKEELEQRIKVFKDSGMTAEAEKAQAELDALDKGTPASAQPTAGGFELPVTESEYQEAGSKFITLPAGSKVAYLEIELGMLEWFQQGVSMKLPVTVIEAGINKGKTDAIHFGVSASAIWKAKDIYKNVTGKDMPFKADTTGVKRPTIDPMVLYGQKAVGYWVETEGRKQGGTGDTVLFPKLDSILPANSKPTT